MNRRLCLFTLFFHISLALWAQGVKNKYHIYISDNHNIQNEACNYSISKDSLIITGLSDYGKSNIDYLRRVLNAEEKKSMNHFMQTFPVDKFSESYFKDYANLGYITPEHYPRVIDMVLTNMGATKKIRLNNIYVTRFAELFQVINTMLPDEVKIKYEEKDFRKKE